MGSDEDQRPRGFVLIGVFFLFGAIMAAYASVTLLKPGTALDALWVLNKAAHTRLASLGKGAGLGFVALSLLLCATSLGWFGRRYWGWFLGTTVVVINAAGDLANLTMGAHWKGAAGVAIAGLILIYMTRPRVRRCFGTKMK